MTNSKSPDIIVAQRRAEERGRTDLGWLRSRHSFSFGEYYDPRHMGFRSLRVINDDWVKAGAGFDTHGHRDMEIITIVTDGSLEHKDSLGHSSILKPGEVQVMTAGRGIRHSEFNPSRTEEARFIQIWIEPHTTGLPPTYSQRSFALNGGVASMTRIAGPATKPDNALTINQDAHVYLINLPQNASLSHSLTQGRGLWVHIIKGECTALERTLKQGDALAIEGAGEITLTGGAEPTAAILFDLA